MGGFSTTIPYGTDLFEVDGFTYCQWEDALEKTNGDTTLMEWATYDVLMNNGHFVNQPTTPRPTPDQAAESAAVAAKQRELEEIVRNGDNFHSYDTREPPWTQSRILSERARLVREREQILKLKEAAFEKKIKNAQPAESSSLANGVIGLVIVVLILIACALIK